jgi:hypothetical protein
LFEKPFARHNPKPVKTEWMARARDLLFPLADHGEAAVDRSAYERMPIPHTFKPRLSFTEALVAVAGAFLRIFLGSLLFAVWGSYSLAAWTAGRSYLWRTAVLLPLLIVFLLAFFLMLLAVAALVRACSPKHP